MKRFFYDLTIFMLYKKFRFPKKNFSFSARVTIAYILRLFQYSWSKAISPLKINNFQNKLSPKNAFFEKFEILERLFFPTQAGHFSIFNRIDYFPYFPLRCGFVDFVRFFNEISRFP